MIEYFWLFLSIACVGWYLIILGYIAVKGAVDIKDMLASLSKSLPSAEDDV